jgi:hypothetical protein
MSAGFAGSWDATRRPIHSSQLLLLHKQQSTSFGLLSGSSSRLLSKGSGSSISSSSSSSSKQASSSIGSGATPGTKQRRLGPKGEQPAADSIEEPRDFNWKAYLLRYPDLRSGNIRTREAAAWHYTQQGHKEGRSYAKVPILLRYTACQGLFNQMYAHLNALVLADYLGADVMLPPSVYRESFSKYFSMDLKKNEVKWTPTSAGALLDVDAIAAHYAHKGERGREGGWRLGLLQAAAADSTGSSCGQRVVASRCSSSHSACCRLSHTRARLHLLPAAACFTHRHARAADGAVRVVP